MPQWTKGQQTVIDSTSEKLVCSAAAGSGKTAVMIERIVRLIREGADPFSFLVITFTNAAAAEMKEKIRKRLMAERSDEKIAAAAEKAGAMEVCTIHAFCQHLIRQEFQIAGVDPFFQICTGAQRSRLIFSENNSPVNLGAFITYGFDEAFTQSANLFVELYARECIGFPYPSGAAAFCANPDKHIRVTGSPLTFITAIGDNKQVHGIMKMR